MRLMAMENGITVWSATTLVRGSEVRGAAAAPSTADMAAESRVLRWPSAVQTLQNTQSQVSQNSSSWLGWEEHLGTTSLRWRAIRSRSWLTRKEGGRFWTPPVGMVMSSRHTGHLNTGTVYTRQEMREIRGPDSGPRRHHISWLRRPGQQRVKDLRPRLGRLVRCYQASSLTQFGGGENEMLLAQKNARWKLQRQDVISFGHNT